MEVFKVYNTMDDTNKKATTGIPLVASIKTGAPPLLESWFFKVPSINEVNFDRNMLTSTDTIKDLDARVREFFGGLRSLAAVVEAYRNDVSEIWVFISAWDQETEDHILNVFKCLRKELPPGFTLKYYPSVVDDIDSLLGIPYRFLINKRG